MKTGGLRHHAAAKEHSVSIILPVVALVCRGQPSSETVYNHCPNSTLCTTLPADILSTATLELKQSIHVQ